MDPFISYNFNNGSTMDVYEATSILQDADQEFVRFREESRFWIQRVLLPLIGTVGIFGNIATILVLTRRGMRSSTNTYLTALAVADLIYLICVLWLSLRHYPNVNENPVWCFIYSHVWPYSLWLADATTNTSVWLAVTFTVERCIAIAYPIKRRMLCKVPRAKKIICCVYLICFTTTITTPFEWTVEKKMDHLTNTSIFEIASSHLGKEKTYQTIYYWFSSIAFVLLPLTLLIIFNSYLIHSFRQSQRFDRRMAAQKKEREENKVITTGELKITSTLITVVIMFIVCQLPTAATLIYEIFHVAKLTPNEEAVLRALGNIFNCLVALNAACNFILYCALSDKYRRTFVLTFFRCFYQPSDSAHSNIPLFPRKVQAPNAGAQLKGHRHYSVPNRGHRALMPLNAMVSNHRFCPRLKQIPSSAPAIARRKTNSYVTVALPAISENEVPSKLCTTSNSSQLVFIHHFSAIFTTLLCSQHQSSRLPMWRNTTSLKGKSVDQSLLEYSSWPSFKPHYPFAVTIPLDNAERSNHSIRRWSSTKKFAVTSFSV